MKDFKAFTGFHRKTLQQRQEQLQHLYPQLNGSFQNSMETAVANLMIQNCIGKISIPLGLGLYFHINNKNYLVPMCTEQPSIVAGACGASKLINQHGGFQAYSSEPIMQGQIQILETQFSQLQEIIQQNKQKLIHKLNREVCFNMYQRGGGIQSISCRKLNNRQSVVDISIHVCQVMGANIVSTICQALGKDLQALITGRVGVKILSNYCTDRRVKSTFCIPLAALSYKEYSGQTVAQRVLQAYQFAYLDVNRACTHNKGIMNGISAVALATGQDTRAIQAAAHCWASRTGKYQPLTKYFIQNSCLVGQIQLPLAVGVHGGALKSNKAYRTCHYLLNNPTAGELAEIIGSVGLASNFAALRALATEGISQGHMSLHAKNIALGLGVPHQLVYEVAAYMKQRNFFTQTAVLEYMKAHNLHVTLRKPKNQTKSLNTFSAEMQNLEPPLKLSIAFVCDNLQGVHLSIEKNSQSVHNEIYQGLLGKHNYQWMTLILKMINQVKLNFRQTRSNSELRNTLKFIGV